MKAKKAGVCIASCAFRVSFDGYCNVNAAFVSANCEIARAIRQFVSAISQFARASCGFVSAIAQIVSASSEIARAICSLVSASGELARAGVQLALNKQAHASCMRILRRANPAVESVGCIGERRAHATDRFSRNLAEMHDENDVPLGILKGPPCTLSVTVFRSSL